MPLLRRLLRPLFLLLAMAALAGCEASGTAPFDAAAMQSARLGTRGGEAVDSRVSTLSAGRQGERPLALHTLPCSPTRLEGKPLRALFLAGGRVAMRVLRDDGRAWSVHALDGQPNLHGRKGERYAPEYRDPSAQVLKIVATVGGLDVLSGQSGSTGHRRYVLRAGPTLRIEGFRKSRDAVARFRFSVVPDACAANLPAGSPRNIGVIGTAVFEFIAPSAPIPDCAPGSATHAFPGNSPGRSVPPLVRRI